MPLPVAELKSITGIAHRQVPWLLEVALPAAFSVVGNGVRFLKARIIRVALRRVRIPFFCGGAVFVRTHVGRDFIRCPAAVILFDKALTLEDQESRETAHLIPAQIQAEEPHGNC